MTTSEAQRHVLTVEIAYAILAPLFCLVAAAAAVIAVHAWFHLNSPGWRSVGAALAVVGVTASLAWMVAVLIRAPKRLGPR